MEISSWLDRCVANDPSAVETLFCLPFSNLPCRLTPEMDHARNMIACHLENRIELSPYQKTRMKYMRERMNEYLTVKADTKAILYLVLMAESYNSAMMLITYVQYFGRQNGMRYISFDVVAEKIFPQGIPHENELQILWNGLKVNHPTGSCNLLDHEAAGLSIRF